MKQIANRRRWMPLVETLESRSVLSVCGVTCELTDGMLHVQGTTSDDLIAVRYDAEAASVSVIGRSDELIGQYSVADVRGLNINGLGGDDSLHVDPALERTLAASGAEGEYATSPSNLHGHGAVVPSSTSNKPTTSTAVNYGPTLGPSLTPALNSVSVANTATSVGGSANLSVTSASVAEHNTHSATSGPDFSLTSHMHDSPMAGAMIATAVSVVSMQTHGHAAVYRPMTGSSADASGMQHESSVVEEAGGEWELTGHDDKHDAAVTSNVSFGKLVSKPCTVSYSGGLVVTSVDGKRQCNCEQKAQAAEEIKQALAGRKDGGMEELAAAAECLPCQALLFGLPGEMQTCSLPLTDDGLLVALLEGHHAGGSCPTRSENGNLVTDTAWLESLQYVGWPLMAASLALVPALFERREKKTTEVSSNPTVEWLFGRLQVEPLLART